MKLQLPSFLSGVAIGKKSAPRWRRTLLWSLISSLVLAVAVWLSLPKRAIAWRIEREAKRAGYAVSVENVTRISPFGSVTLSGVTWIPPASARAAGEPIAFNKLAIGLAPWGYYQRKEIDATVEGELPQGRIDAKVKRDAKVTQANGKITDLPLGQVPYLRQTIVAPVEGAATVKFDVKLNEHRLEQATGVIEVQCRACAVGDGQTPLLIPGAKGMLASGVTMPKVILGDLEAKIVIADGNATVESFTWQGEGIEIAISGTYRLRDPFSASRPDLVVKLKVNDELKANNDALALLVSSGGPSAMMDPPDQAWLGFSYLFDEKRNKNVFVGIKKRAEILGTGPGVGSAGSSASDRPTSAAARRASNRAGMMAPVTGPSASGASGGVQRSPNQGASEQTERSPSQANNPAMRVNPAEQPPEPAAKPADRPAMMGAGAVAQVPAGANFAPSQAIQAIPPPQPEQAMPTEAPPQQPPVEQPSAEANATAPAADANTTSGDATSAAPAEQPPN